MLVIIRRFLPPYGSIPCVIIPYFQPICKKSGKNRRSDKSAYPQRLLFSENRFYKEGCRRKKRVENLKNLDAAGKIELCGPFKGYPGVAGMVIFKTSGLEEAEALCKLEPLVAEGYATYTLAALQVADKENDYLL